MQTSPFVSQNAAEIFRRYAFGDQHDYCKMEVDQEKASQATLLRQFVVVSMDPEAFYFQNFIYTYRNSGECERFPIAVMEFLYVTNVEKCSSVQSYVT